jgi:uncharacterized membrane protein YebE (DUF533 family)
MNPEHPPIGNQFIELIYGVEAIEAEDNANYAKALLIIAGADGVVSDAEWTWFYERGRAMGVPEFVLESFKGFDWRNAKIQDHCGTSRTVARILIYDAITMARADGPYSPEEIAAVREAAGILGVSEDTVESLEGLVELEETLRRMRHRLLRARDY